MAASDVMQAAVLAVRIIETNPASQVGKLLTERLHLLVRENADSAQVAIFVKEVDLLGVQLVLRQRSMIHIRKKRTDGVMFNRKIVNHRAKRPRRSSRRAVRDSVVCC